MTVKIRVKDKLEDDTLDLSCCDLEDVPVKEISAIKKGTHLDLSNNQLVKLPDTFVTLTHIVKLDLSKNLLEELPENIGDLKQLKHLDLYSNKISRLPLSFGELKNLKWLDLKDNPLNEVLSLLAGPCGDNEQCQSCACHVISYYINVKETIEKKKELAMIAAAADERKREAKRRKKKKKNASKDGNNTNEEKEKDAPAKSEAPIVNNDVNKSKEPEPNSKPQVADDSSSKDGLCSTLCRIFSSFLLALLLLAAVVVLAVAIFPKFDEKRSDQLVQYLEARTGLPVKTYQRLGTNKLDSLIDYAGFLMIHTRILIRDTYQRHFGEELVDADDADL